MSGCTFMLIGTAILLVLLVSAVVIGLWHDTKRTECRVCGVKLSKPGGRGIALIGEGFCDRCASDVLKKVRTGG